MSSTCSLGFKDVEERAPGGVGDGFGKVMVFHHAGNRQVLNGNQVILLGVLPGRFKMEITSLPCDLEMGQGRATSSLASSLASLRATGDQALFAPECRLTLAIVARILAGSAFGVGQEGLESHIQANIRMVACREKMFGLWLGFTDNQSIPVSICPIDQVTGLGDAFDRAMQLDLEGTAQLLGNRQMLPIRGKREIGFVLAQLNGMPAIGLLETGESARFTQFSAGKEAFECLIQAVCQHLDSRGRDMFAASSFELSRQIIFQQKPALDSICFPYRHYDICTTDAAPTDEYGIRLSVSIGTIYQWAGLVLHKVQSIVWL